MSLKQLLPLIGLCLIIICISTATVHAQITLKTDAKTLFNQGDTMTITTSVKGSPGDSGFLDLNVACGSENTLIFRKSLFFRDESTQTIEAPWRVALSQKNTSSCKVQATYKDESQETPLFQISNTLAISVRLNEKRIYPKESLSVAINVSKASGSSLNGVAILTIEDVVNQTLELVDGKVSVSIPIKETTLPGTKELTVKVFDRDDQGKIQNSGTYTDEVEIGPLPTTIRIETNTSLTPPANITLKVQVLDQGGSPMKNETLALRIVAPDNKVMQSASIKSDIPFSYSFPSNALRGAWSINVFRGPLTASLPVYVLDHRAVSIEISQNSSRPSVAIKNVGNVPYEGIVELSLANDNGTISIPPVNVSLDIEKAMVYDLPPQAVKGKYDIKAGDTPIGSVSFLNVAVIGTGAVTASQIKGKLSSSIVIFLSMVTLILLGYLTVFVVKEKRVKSPRTAAAQSQSQTVMYRSLQKPSTTSPAVGHASAPRAQTPQKKVYVLFARFKPHPNKEQLESIEHFFSKNGLRFTKVNEESGFVLFNEDKFTSPGPMALTIAQNLFNHTQSLGIKMRCALHRQLSDTTFSSLKAVSHAGQKIAHLAQKPIVLSQGMYNEIHANNPSIQFSQTDVSHPNEKDKVIKLFSLILQ